MPDQVPSGAPSNPAPTPSPDVPAKAKWPLSRTILLAILAICLAALGFDYFAGRQPQHTAFDNLNAKLPSEKKANDTGAMITKDELLSPDDVHKILDRSPDVTEEDPTKASELMRDEETGGAPVIPPPAMVELYKFPGALRTYVVRVAYLKGMAPKGGSPYVMSGLNMGTQSRFGN